MLATTHAATLLGVDGRPVSVQVHVSQGLPGFTIVGQPDAACREARDRVRAALLSSRLPWPQQRVTVNLAPSGLRKLGGGLDLAIAVGVLAALEHLPAEAVRDVGFLGELGLDGSIRPVPGTLPLVDALGTDHVVVAPGVHAEAEVVSRCTVRSAPSLRALVEVLRGEAPWPDPPAAPPAGATPTPPDLAEVRGHALGRLAVEVAAAGGHHLLLVGPPGTGKTMLATRLPGLLPPLEGDAALETTKVHSAAGLPLPPGGLLRTPPLRRPHQSASAVAVLGGGSLTMRPGEVSLAHGGVLFLDELGEFPPSVLDALRQPLEEGVMRVARAEVRATLPARFLLVAAMNPCPCGGGERPGDCCCSDAQLARYARRVSGPLLDRFDLRLAVPPVTPAQLLAAPDGEASAPVAERVAAARGRAAARGVRTNADLTGARLEAATPLADGVPELLEGALASGALTGRGLARVRAVARTIADLDGRDGPLRADDVGLALQLRSATLGPQGRWLR